MFSGRQKEGVVILVAMVLFAIAFMVLCQKRDSTLAEQITLASEPDSPDSLFTFDPNTVSYAELLKLGFDKQTAVSLLKYRERGKVFTIAEEFALCYGITDSMFFRLQPYIVIGKEFRAKPFVQKREQTPRQRDWEARAARLTPHPKQAFRIDTVSAEYLRSIGFSFRQAEGVIEYRDSGAEGIRNMEELRDCWAVTEQMADSLARYIIFPDPKPYGGKVEINSADSATLVALRGIGAVSAKAIIEYRKLLGGYVSIEQLKEIKCVTSENFAKFSKQICCDSCVFSKIDINFAPASVLEYHPYMTRRAINRIIELRKSKGGWKSFEEIVNDNIFTVEQAVALEPYLHFGTIPLDFGSNSN